MNNILYNILIIIFFVLGKRQPKDIPIIIWPTLQAIGNEPPFNKLAIIQPNKPTIDEEIPNLFKYIAKMIYPKSNLILLIKGILTTVDITTYKAMPIPYKDIFLFSFMNKLYIKVKQNIVEL